MGTSVQAPVEVIAGPSVRTVDKKDASRQLAALDAQLAEHLTKADLDALVSMTTGLIGITDPDPVEDLEASLISGHQRPDARKVIAAQRTNLLRAFALRRKVLEDSLTAVEVADMLGAASRQTPHDRLAAGTLLAVKDGGKARFPTWQFDPEGPDGVLEGLPAVLGELGPRTQLGRVLWFLGPRRGLGGSSPLEALRHGRATDVVAEAAAARVA